MHCVNNYHRQTPCPSFMLSTILRSSQLFPALKNTAQTLNNRCFCKVSFCLLNVYWNVLLHLDSRSICGLIVIWNCFMSMAQFCMYNCSVLCELKIDKHLFQWPFSAVSSADIMAPFASPNKAGGKSFFQDVKRLRLIEIWIALWMNDYVILNPSLVYVLKWWGCWRAW